MSNALAIGHEVVRTVILGEVVCAGVRLFHPALQMHHNERVRVQIGPLARVLRVRDAHDALICEMQPA